MKNRYAITFVDKDGLRVLHAQNTSSNFFDTKKKADQRIKDMYENNSIDTLNSVYGVNPQFKVLPIECYPSGDSTRSTF